MASQHKSNLHRQMQDKADLKQQAYLEYLKEKEQVDKVIQKMINEDLQMQELTRLKQEQSKMDMISSVNEKNQMKRRIKELEEYENQMLAKFAQEQAAREGEIAAKKAEAEAARDEIYRKLEEEE
jgi:hypothetical protein